MNIPVDFAGAVLAVNALVELIKRTPVGDRLRGWYPIIAEVLGFGLGYAIGLGWFESLFIGLSAMGLYGGTKHTVKSFK